MLLSFSRRPFIIPTEKEKKHPTKLEFHEFNTEQEQTERGDHQISIISHLQCQIKAQTNQPPPQ